MNDNFNVTMKAMTFLTNSTGPTVVIPKGVIPELNLQLDGDSVGRNPNDALNGSEKTFADDIHFITCAIIGPIACLFGMAGNLLSIITWQRPGMGSSTGRYLTGQAMVNCCLLLLFLMGDSLQSWSPEVKYSFIYGAYFSYFGFPVFFVCSICTVWITVGLTLDRCLVICWVTKAKTLCNESRANVGLILITLSSFIISLPYFAAFTPVYHEYDQVNNNNNNNSNNSNNSNNNSSIKERRLAFAETKFATGEGGKFYQFWIHCIILILTPWISVLFMNVIIIFKISEANKRMADKKNKESVRKSKESENQITRLLLTVTFTFLLVMGLQCVADCLWIRKPPNVNLVMVYASYSFGKIGLVFNSSLNFPLYCLSGRRFRLELLKMLGLVKKDLLLSSVVDTSSSNISNSMATSATS